MALQSRRRLALAGALLGASMLPLSLQMHWRGPRLAEPEVLIITLLTMGLGLWGAFGGRVAYVLMLLRAGLQLLGTLLMLTTISSYRSDAAFLRTQAGVSLALTVATMWLLLSRAVRGRVWGRPMDDAKTDDAQAAPPRPASQLGTLGVLGGMGATALLLGSVEQAWMYGHSSVVEFVVRSLYLVLPWAGAWLLARLGRDRFILTTLGALLGEMASEMVSLVVSGAGVESVLYKLALPLNNLPALIIGLALAVFGPRRPLWQLGLALPVAQVVYRAATWSLTTPSGVLPWQAALLAGLGGMGCAAAIYRFRRPLALGDTPKELPGAT